MFVVFSQFVTNLVILPIFVIFANFYLFFLISTCFYSFLLISTCFSYFYLFLPLATYFIYLFRLIWTYFFLILLIYIYFVHFIHLTQLIHVMDSRAYILDPCIQEFLLKSGFRTSKIGKNDIFGPLNAPKYDFT